MHLVNLISSRQKAKQALNSAFSLIEIVLAVGIMSFALVGILGLLPVALSNAADSRTETQATFIARTTFAGLSATPPFLPADNADPVGDRTTVEVTAVDLTVNGSTTLEFNEEGELVGSHNSDSTGSDFAAFSVEVSWEVDTPRDGLSQVTVNVHTPVGAATGTPGRTDYSFASIVSIN